MPRLHLRLTVRRAMLAVAIAAGLLYWARPRDPIRIGQAAPVVDALLPDGGFIYDGYKSGKFVLLTFWSMNDAESLRQFEALKQVRREFVQDNRFLIVSVCTDEDWDVWLRFMDKQGRVDYGDKRGGFTFYMDHKWWNTFQDQNTYVTADAYGVRRVPEAFLIGPDGRLQAIHIPTEELRVVVAAALNGTL